MEHKSSTCTNIGGITGLLRRSARLFHDPTMVALALTLSAVSAISIVRPQTVTYTGISPGEFKRMKAAWCNCADMVIGGDSRVMAALSPAEMQADLRDVRILNCGFPGAGFADAYCRWLDGVIDSSSKRKIILIGVTPNSLTEGACRRNGFTEEVLEGKRERGIPAWAQMSVQRLEPINPSDLWNLFHGRKLNRWRSERCEDGWFAQQSDWPMLEVGLAQYREQFDPELNGPVSARVVETLLLSVRRWTKESIEVYGFRPPTCPEMVGVENKEADFSESAFVAKFREAGGEWIDVNPSAYLTTDGSHLQRDMAIRLSRELARKIVYMSGVRTAGAACVAEK